MEREYGRPVICPAAGGGFAARRDTTCGSPSVASPRLRRPRPPSPRRFARCKRAAGFIAELDVVASGFDANDSQALVVVTRSIPTFFALLGTPAFFPPRA